MTLAEGREQLAIDLELTANWRRSKALQDPDAGPCYLSTDVEASSPGGVRPTGAEWIHEIKHDGYRMIVRKEGGFSAARPSTGHQRS
jgi:hypothetical protein